MKLSESGVQQREPARNLLKTKLGELRRKAYQWSRMMSPLKLLLLLLLGTAFLTSPSFGQLAVPGDVLFEEAFAEGPFPRGKNTPVGDTGWVARTTFGDWVKTDAGIEGTINPDDGHTPVIAFTPPAELEDLIVELEFRFVDGDDEGKQSVRVAVDNREAIKKGHVCSAWANWANDFVPTGLTLEHIYKEEVLPKPEKKWLQWRDNRITMGNKPAAYEAGKWYTLRLEMIAGRALTTVIDDQGGIVTVSGELRAFATPKSKISLTTGTSRHELRAFRVIAAAANENWTDAKTEPMNGKRPNIILILADDVGVEAFNCYGGEDYETPCIDKLAATGLKFTHAYSQPLCTPTRVQIMTGKYNHRNWTYFGILDPEETTFGHRMQAAGYTTFIAGKWQLQSYDPPDWPNAESRRGKGMKVADSGFDEYSLFHAWETEDKGSRYPDPKMDNDGTIETFEGKYGEDIWVEKIADFMERNKDSNKPMFVYYPMALPHWPFNPTPDSEAWEDPSRRYEEDTAFFPDMMTYMDKLVGQLVDNLEEQELREDTLIIFYSDNGTDRRITSTMNGVEIQGGKAYPIQSGVRVPLIANWPGTIETAVCEDLVDASDFVPTLADLARLKVEDWWETDGQSFALQLFGKPHPSPRESIFCWYDPRPGWDKEKFDRSVFALDKTYKKYRDGRLMKINPLVPVEMEITGELDAEAKAADARLSAVIKEMMRGGEPPVVDAYGDPIEE